MASRSPRRRGPVSGKGSRKRTAKRPSIKSLSAGVPGDYQAVESVERTIMEHGSMARGMDARFLSLPALNIISLIAFAALAAYQVTTFKYDIQSNIDDMKKSVAQLSKRIDDMSSDTDAKQKRRWSRLDMQMWCKDTEDTNRDPASGKKGFTCGAIGPMSLDGTQ